MNHVYVNNMCALTAYCMQNKSITEFDIITRANMILQTMLRITFVFVSVAQSQLIYLFIDLQHINKGNIELNLYFEVTRIMETMNVYV